MMRTDQFEHVVQTLDAAAKGQADWRSEALKQVARFTESNQAIVWTSNGFRLPVFEAYNVDPCFLRDYPAEWAGRDPNVQYVVTHRRQRIVHDAGVISEREKGGNPK